MVNKLTDSQKKALTLDIQAGKMKVRELAVKYKVSEKTIKRARAAYKKRQEDRGPSILESKRALETAKADSMLMHLMERMIHNTARMEANEEKYSATKCLELNIKTAEIVLLVRNSLAFTEVPEVSDDYNENDVELFEWLLDNVPGEKKEELLARFTKSDDPGTKTGGGKGSDVQQA